MELRARLPLARRCLGCLGAESPRKLRCVGVIEGWNDGIPALRCTVVLAALLIAFAPGIAHAGQSTSATLHVRLVGPAGLATSLDVSGGDPPRRWSTPIATGQVSTLHRLPPATYTATVPAPNGAASASIEVALAAGTIVWLEATSDNRRLCLASSSSTEASSVTALASARRS